MYGEMRKYRNILVGKFEEKRPLARPVHRWKHLGKIGQKRIRMGWLETGTSVAHSREYSKPSVQECLNQLSDC
jgi:hypothetical protein